MSFWKRLFGKASEASLSVNHGSPPPAVRIDPGQGTSVATVTDVEPDNGETGICDFEKGGAIDRLAQGGSFGFARSAGLLIKPKAGREIKFGVRVTGTIRCHGCGTDLPFIADVVFPIGLEEAGEVRCRRCGSVIDFVNCGHDVSGTRCRVLIARPFVAPSSGDRSRLMFGDLAAEEITLEDISS